MRSMSFRGGLFLVCFANANYNGYPCVGEGLTRLGSAMAAFSPAEGCPRFCALTVTRACAKKISPTRLGRPLTGTLSVSD